MSTQSPPPSQGAPRSSRTDNATVLAVVAVVVAVVVGFVAIGLLVGDGSSTATPIGQAFTTPTQTPPTPTPSSPPPTGGGLSCTPPPALPENPQQFDTPPDPSLAEASTWQVTLETNCGSIVMELDGKSAPQTVASFLFLSQQGFYDDVPCHRLTTAAADGLSVLQCGDPTGLGTGGPGYGYGIENAPRSGAYPTGTVAMARAQDPNSNGSQFFIVYDDTTLPTDGGGYSIFGTVMKGLPIVQAVAARGVASDGTAPAPAQPVSILSVSVEKL